MVLTSSPRWFAGVQVGTAKMTCVATINQRVSPGIEPGQMRQRLARARWLGYLKTETPRDPLVNLYLAWCLASNQAAVVLYAMPRCRATIVYQLPSWDRVLPTNAVERLRDRAQRLRVPGRARPTIITAAGGEITGLLAGRAEELAFRIADAAHDAEHANQS